MLHPRCRGRRRLRAAARLAAIVAVAFVAEAPARADIDLRMPMRLGFAYDGGFRQPVFPLAVALAIDVARLSRYAWLDVIAEGDVRWRFGAAADDPTAVVFTPSAGVGLVVRPRGGYALMFEASGGPLFDDKRLMGATVATTLSVYPYYIALDDATKCPRSVLVHMASSVALWVQGRVDWSDVGKGGTLAVGVSFDVIRVLFSPLFSLAATGSHPCSRDD